MVRKFVKIAVITAHKQTSVFCAYHFDHAHILSGDGILSGAKREARTGCAWDNGNQHHLGQGGNRQYVGDICVETIAFWWQERHTDYSLFHLVERKGSKFCMLVIPQPKRGVDGEIRVVNLGENAGRLDLLSGCITLGAYEHINI